MTQQKLKNLNKEKIYWDKNSILWPFVEKHVPEPFKFIAPTVNTCTITYTTHIHHHMNETMEHRLHRVKQV